jgi:hypothetical protein
MAKSPFGVLAPTIFVLLLIIVGFIIYNAQQNPEDPKKKNLLDSLGVVQGTDVDVFENSSEDFNSVKERYDELKERLSKYGEIIDVEEYIKTLDLECAVYPGKDGCDPDLFDTDTRGCCVLKDPDLADDPELLDTTGQQSTVQDATMNLDCLGLPESGDDPCPNTNERYDANAVEGGCCVRACSVYPIKGECGSNPNFPNLKNGCCEPDDRTKERLEREMREAKREMLIGIAAMILGDTFLTVMLPKLGQEILNMSEAKKARVTAAETAAGDRAAKAADERGITGKPREEMIKNAKKRAGYAERWKNTKSVNELVKHVEAIKTQKASTKPLIRKVGGDNAKRLATALARASAKFAAKVGARIAVFIARAMMKLGSGPLALFLLMFDAISMMVDIGDGENTLTYISFDDMVKQRNKIIFMVWDIFQKAEGGPYDYPIVYPVNMAFPDEATNAQARLNQKCVEDTLTKWVNIGAEGLTEENERDFNVFCKYIMLSIGAQAAKDKNGVDISETVDALNDDEMEIINTNTSKLIQENPEKYWEIYFNELCQELKNDESDQPLTEKQWDTVLKNGPHPADCPSADGSLLQNMKPDRSMIKFVKSMCDATNPGISLTERGCYYINRPAKRRAWEVYNSIYQKAPIDLTETTNMWTASYDTHVLTIDPEGNKEDGVDHPPVVKVHRRDLNDQPLTEKIGWFTPYGFLVSMCEGERDTIEGGGGRPVKPCAEEGVHFDVNTGLCNITDKYCERYIRGKASRSVRVEDQNADFPACEDYSPTSDVGIMSWIVGEEWSLRYNEQRDEAKNSIDKFMDDPSAENFGQALYENVGLHAQTVIGKVQDEWKNNKDKYEKKEEAVARTVMDPLGFDNFLDAMGDKLGGKYRYCEPPDNCKVFHAKHTGGNFQNWVVLVKEYADGGTDENGNYTVERYPNPSVSDQNQVKDGEQHQFYIPGERKADPDKGIKRRSAGWFRATAVGDVEGDMGVFNVFTGGDCDREITFPYEQIETPGPDNPTPAVIPISSWRGCMENKDKAAWQEQFSAIAEAGWEFVADSYTCGEDVVFDLGLTYAVEGANIAYDELKEVFGEDGYFANPDQWLANYEDKLNETGMKDFGYESAANVGDCLGITDGDCDLMFGRGKNLPPEIQNEIGNFNNKKNIWEQNKAAHDDSIKMVINRANDIGKYQKEVNNDVAKLFTSPKDSKIGSFFVGVGDSFEDLVTGGVSGDDLIDNLLDPGGWRLPGF